MHELVRQLAVYHENEFKVITNCAPVCMYSNFTLGRNGSHYT